MLKTNQSKSTVALLEVNLTMRKRIPTPATDPIRTLSTKPLRDQIWTEVQIKHSRGTTQKWSKCPKRGSRLRKTISGGLSIFWTTNSSPRWRKVMGAKISKSWSAFWGKILKTSKISKKVRESTSLNKPKYCQALRSKLWRLPRTSWINSNLNELKCRKSRIGSLSSFKPPRSSTSSKPLQRRKIKIRDQRMLTIDCFKLI